MSQQKKGGDAGPAISGEHACIPPGSFPGAAPEPEATIEIHIEGKPVPAPRVRVPRGGRAYYDDKTGYKAWVETVQVMALQQLRGRPLWTGAVGMSLTFRGVPWTRGDWDNLGKGVSDALQGILYENDHQVRSCLVELVDGGVPGLTIVAWQKEAEGGG